MRRPLDPLTELQSTVATLQVALNRAYERVRELEHIASAANARACEAIELADTVQMQELRRETEARALRQSADISP